MSESVATPAEPGTPATSSRRGWKALKYGFLILFLVVGALVVNRIIFLNRLWADCEILRQNGYSPDLSSEFSNYPLGLESFDQFLANCFPTEAYIGPTVVGDVAPLPQACLPPLARLSSRMAFFLYSPYTLIDDHQAVILGSMDRLQSLCFNGGNLTDSGLKDVLRAPRLDELDIHNCKMITDAGLQGIEHHRTLKILSISGSRFGDLGAASIGRCTTLDQLCLEEAQITPVGFSELTKLPRLSELNLTNCPMLDDSIAEHFQNLNSLKHLTLSRIRVGDKTCRAIVTLPKLSVVYLDDCPITFENLKVFQGKVNLRLELSEKQQRILREDKANRNRNMP